MLRAHPNVICLAELRRMRERRRVARAAGEAGQVALLVPSSQVVSSWPASLPSAFDAFRPDGSSSHGEF